jgi:hypothetical protein
MTLAARRDLLAQVLDTLVPPSGEFPGAGSIAFDHVVATASASAEVDTLLSRALGLVEEAARSAGTGDFAGLDVTGREDVLRSVEAADPVVFEALVRHTYDGYYSHPAVLTRLGLEPGPLHPHGYQVEAVELPELARVAARGSIYRPA